MCDPTWSNIVGLANLTISGKNRWTIGMEATKTTPEFDPQESWWVGTSYLAASENTLADVWPGDEWGWDSHGKSMFRFGLSSEEANMVWFQGQLWTPNCCAAKAGPKPTWITFMAAQFPSRQCCRPDSAMVTRVKMAHLKSQCVSLMTLDLPHLGFPWIPWEGLVKEDPFLVYSGQPTVQWKKWLPALGRWEWPSPKISDPQIIHKVARHFIRPYEWARQALPSGVNVEQWDIKKLHGILQFLAFLWSWKWW